MAHSVSVIICAHSADRIGDLRRAVASVVGQSPPPDELLVVVDHNRQLLDAAADLPANVVASDGPPGLSGARNTGTRRATGQPGVRVLYESDGAWVLAVEASP